MLVAFVFFSFFRETSVEKQKRSCRATLCSLLTMSVGFLSAWSKLLLLILVALVYEALYGTEECNFYSLIE